MSDLRKAAEMALEALEEINKLSIGENAICLPAEIDDAMEALRQALAQPEQYDQTALELCNVCGWKAVIPDEGCFVCARKNQTPVAWRNTETGKFCTGGFLRKDLAKWTPLYTAPPKREWVELDVNEVVEVIHKNIPNPTPELRNKLYGLVADIDLWLQEKNT